jgi:pimeloyl-ACP methyl ester carboxylesterase
MTDDYDVWLADFNESSVVVHGIRTAVYCARETNTKQRTVLFVHGINGDYHGLVPLAYELRNDCQVIFVDMPGHGMSATPRTDDIARAVRDWSRNLVGGASSGRV